MSGDLRKEHSVLLSADLSLSLVPWLYIINIHLKPFQEELEEVPFNLCLLFRYPVPKFEAGQYFQR